MIRAASCFQIPGRSWPREMRPVPIAPTLMRLPGAFAPNTEAGTIAGKPPSTDVETIPVAATVMNSRRVALSVGVAAMTSSLLRVGPSASAR